MARAKPAKRPKVPKVAKPAPVIVSDQLQHAADTLAADHPEPALLAALEAWRETRNVAIACAIDRISKRIQRRPLGGGTLEAMSKRWHSIAEACDAFDVPRLLAALASSWATAVPKRIVALRAFPADPRIAVGLATFLGAAPYQVAGSNVAYDAARALLLECPDERVLEALAPWAGRASIVELIGEVRAAAKPGRALTDDEHAAFSALDCVLAASRSGDELLAAIYAAPTDDAPRAVYADWLLERNDPHGELIGLQLRARPLSEDAAARERELVSTLAATLGQPFAKVTKGERTIARGFVAKVTIEPKNSRSMATAIAAPEWRTVEQIDIAQPHYIMDDTFCSPTFAHLRVLRGATIEIVRALLLGTPRAIEVLTIASWHGSKLQALLADPDPWSALPALHTLGFTFASIEPAMVAPLWKQPVAAQLRMLELPDVATTLDDWLAALEPTPIVEFATRPLTLRCHRKPRARAWTIEVPQLAYSPVWPTLFAQGLEALAPQRVASLLLEGSEVPEVQRIFAAVDRFRDRVTWRLRQ